MANREFKVESGVWTGKRIMSLMFGKKKSVYSGDSAKNKATRSKPTTKTKKTSQKGLKQVKNTENSQKTTKNTQKPVKVGSYREYVSKRLKEGEKDFKVIGKEWQGMKNNNSKEDE